MRHLAVAAILTVLATPALAQTDDPIALFAKVAAGLADTGKVSIGTLGVGDVSRKDNAFTVALSGGPAVFTFAQEKPCVFTELSEMQNQPTLKIRFNLDHVSTIKFDTQGPFNDLNAVAMSFDGNADNLVELVNDKGEAKAVPPAASIVTSLSLDDLNAAAKALQSVCPPAQ